MKQTLSTIKSWFRKGLYPTEAQFWDTWDSFWHKDEKIILTAVDGLADSLNAKAEITTVDNLTTTVNTANNRISELESKEAIDLGLTAKRTDGVVYLTIPAYLNETLPQGAICFSSLMNVVNEGTQSATVVAGYEPVVILHETVEYPLFFDTAQTQPVQLKDIMNKLVYYKLQQGLSSMPIGLEPATTVDPGIAPANAVVIASLAENLVVDDATAENIKIEQAASAGLELQLTPLIADAKKSIYLSKTSSFALTAVGAAGGNVTLPAGAKADLFYSQSADEWSVDVVDSSTSTGSSNTLQSFLFFKTFTAPNRSYYYKLATIKSTGNLGKHSCSFKLFTASTPQQGNYVSSYLLNLRRTDTSYVGNLLCLSYNKDVTTLFSPEDVLVTYDGDYASEVVTTIWKRGSSPTANAELFNLAIEFVGESAQLEFATNSYNGVKESLDHKPLVADGFDFVIDTAYNNPNKLNILTASAGAATYTLSRVNQNEIQGNLPSGVASTIVLDNKVVGEDNQYIVHFTTGATAPTLVYSNFTPMWLGGSAPSLEGNTAYSFVFEYRHNGTSWFVKASYGAYK